MTERDLDDLIHRYQHGLARPEEVHFLNELQQTNLTELQEAETDDTQQEHDKVGERVWQGLVKDIDQPRYWFVVIRNSFQKKTPWWAAAILILLGLAAFPFLLSSAKDADYQTYATNKSAFTVESITLPDGSKIMLKAASSVALHRRFNQADRRVKLTGSAFFDVARNTDKPFIIQTGELLTKVLGTSFLITNSETSREVEVKVFTGKVSVQVDPSVVDKAQNAELLLTPNLKAVFHKESKSLHEALSDNPTVLASESSPTGQAFNYHDQKLHYILKQLEDAYQIDIILLDEDDGNRLLTGDLSSLTLYQKLNLICSATDLAYEIKGSKIILKDPH